ncbi:MAG: Mfa1 family fimbria major subunit, partial [Tannerellaceae bacterium]|nr:Mfa1 family fimbria major subunit [Tannerellaceae bacterium]
IKMVLPMLLIGLGIAGCTSTDAESGFLPDNSLATGETGYLSLNLFHTNIETKAAPDDDYGIEPEYSVESVRVILYKAKDGIAAYSFDIDATNNKGSALFDGPDVATVTSPGSRRFTTKAKEIEVDDYYLVVVLNYPPAVDAVTKVGKHIDEFGNAVYELGNDYSILTGVANPRYDVTKANDYKFFMSNFKKDVFIEGKRAMYDTEQDAETNPVNVIVDRAVAKAKMTDENLVTEHGTVENIVWKLDITNKQTYWVRHAAKMVDGTWEPRNEMDRTVLYAEDPNFDNISKLRNPSITTDPKAYFNYITDADMVKDNAGWEYVTENTMEGDEQWEDVVTRMILRLNFIPTGFAAGDSYFWWREHALAPEDIKNYAADLSSVPEKLNGLQQILQDMLDSGYDFTNPVAVDHPEIEFYKNGISYFATPIRHFNDMQAPAKMQYGRYGIVRNNQYTLNLKKISGPGKPDIPGPGTKVDEDDEFLSVDIEIQNWYSRDIQDIEE